MSTFTQIRKLHSFHTHTLNIRDTVGTHTHSRTDTDTDVLTTHHPLARALTFLHTMVQLSRF